MNKKTIIKNIIKIILFGYLILNSCQKVKTDNNEFTIYLKNFNAKNDNFRYIDIEINENNIYKRKNDIVADYNNLYRKELSKEEKVKITNLIDDIKINNLTHSYIKNKYQSKYHYEFYLLKNGNMRNVKVFSDTLPSKLSKLITYMEELSSKNSYQKIKPSINGVQGIDIWKIVKYPNDTIKLSEFESYRFWKNLINYKGKIDTVKQVTPISFDYTFILSDLLRKTYEEKKIKNLYLKKDTLYVKYRDNSLYKLNNNFDTFVKELK